MLHNWSNFCLDICNFLGVGCHLRWKNKGSLWIICICMTLGLLQFIISLNRICLLINNAWKFWCSCLVCWFFFCSYIINIRFGTFVLTITPTLDLVSIISVNILILRKASFVATSNDLSLIKFSCVFVLFSWVWLVEERLID